jgi:hypothetical protein
LETQVLVAANLLVYATLAAGLVLLLRPVRSLRGDTFFALGEVLRARFPDLPTGFTLREGLTRARQVAPQLDWGAIDEELRAYEGYRYGGLPDSGAPSVVIAELTAALGRSRD